MLSDTTKQNILKLQKAYPEKRSALIPALHLAQDEIGYIPPEAQKEVATLFDIDPNEVQSVVSFYDMFFENPVGEKVIHICKNISCMLNGSDAIISKVCAKLHISPGETTQDGKYTLITSECLAACDRAPMMMIGEEVVGPVAEEDIDKILDGDMPHA